MNKTARINPGGGTETFLHAQTESEGSPGALFADADRGFWQCSFSIALQAPVHKYDTHQTTKFLKESKGRKKEEGKTCH